MLRQGAIPSMCTFRAIVVVRFAQLLYDRSVSTLHVVCNITRLARPAGNLGDLKILSRFSEATILLENVKSIEQVLITFKNDWMLFFMKIFKVCLCLLCSRQTRKIVGPLPTVTL